MIVMLVLLFGFMYFAMIRPQRKQQQQRQTMLNAMKKGDSIVTIGGLHGVIDSIDTAKQIVVIDADGVFLTFNLSAVRQVNNDGAATAPVAAATPAAEAKPEAPVAEAKPEAPEHHDDDKPYTEG